MIPPRLCCQRQCHKRKFFVVKKIESETCEFCMTAFLRSSGLILGTIFCHQNFTLERLSWINYLFFALGNLEGLNMIMVCVINLSFFLQFSAPSYKCLLSFTCNQTSELPQINRKLLLVLYSISSFATKCLF